MTDPVSNPASIDPASRGDLAGTVRLILTKFLQGMDDMIPAKVIAYDRTTNQARVQPMIAMLTTGNQIVQRAQIAEVPVLQIGGGGFVLSFPIVEGDLGWIKANDRDISLFKQSFENVTPNTDRLHSFEDALFIPDTMFRSVTINSEDAENVVLQSIDGTQRIALWPGKIKITATAIELVSDTLTHNGKNIGDTHEHSGVQPGGGDTGPPI